MQDYVSRFKSLYLLIDKVLQAKIMDWFVQRLKHVVQQEVELRNPQTFEEAIRIAERIDAIDFKNQEAWPTMQSLILLCNIIAQQPLTIEIDILQESLTP